MIEWYYLEFQTSSWPSLRMLLIEIHAYLESFGLGAP